MAQPRIPCRADISLPAGLSPLTPAALRSARESTAPTLSLRTSLVYVECATVQVGSMQRRNCLLRLGRIRHLDESEAARPPSLSILYHIHMIHFSVRLEKRSQRRIGCGKIQIAYEDVFHVLAHSVFQLCGLDEADRNGQALAGLLKGTTIIPLRAILRLISLFETAVYDSFHDLGMDAPALGRSDSRAGEHFVEQRSRRRRYPYGHRAVYLRAAPGPCAARIYEAYSTAVSGGEDPFSDEVLVLMGDCDWRHLAANRTIISLPVMLPGAQRPRLFGGESGATWKFKASGTCLTC